MKGLDKTLKNSGVHLLGSMEGAAEGGNKSQINVERWNA